MLLNLIIFSPLFSSLLAGFFGRFLGMRGVARSSIFFMLIALGSSIFLGIFSKFFFLNSVSTIILGEWFNFGGLYVEWGFYLDNLSILMMTMVLFISFFVHFYSLSYMSQDPHLIRFMAYLSLFTFFMLILVASHTYLQMFIGWEGVGLCSYLLINFWHSRIQANKAAIKAMVLNRIGDFCLCFALFLMYWNFNTLEYSLIFANLPLFYLNTFYFFGYSVKVLDLICLFILFGAMGKSAQIFLHVWLPDAMEGPTPVSALIHAATMVTAGVYLIIRSSHLFEYSAGVSVWLTFIGILTSLVAASIGIVQNDLKKVIAYSTCSQLGYMICACGLSAYNLSFFHLFTHAFFKALLFLSAGSVIHATADEQDMRKMGGLQPFLPVTYSAMLIGSFSLAGFPFLAGFFSKEAILEASYASYNVISHFSFYLGSFVAFLTAFYSFRLVYLTFLAKPNGFKNLYRGIHESDNIIVVTLVTLTICAIFIGYLFSDLLIGLGSFFWNNSIFLLPFKNVILDREFIPLSDNFFLVIIGLLGIFCSFFFYHLFYKYLVVFNLTGWGKLLYTFLNRKWFFDRVFNHYIGFFYLISFWTLSYNKLDRGVIEHFGPKGITQITNKLVVWFKWAHSGFLYHSLVIIVIVIVSFPMFLA